MTKPKHFRSMIATGLVAALVTLAVAAVAATGAVKTAAAPADRTFQVTLEPKAMHDTDLKPKGPSAGDGWTGAGPIKENGGLVGRVEVASTLLDPKYQAMIQHGTLILTDGTISYSGTAVGKRPPSTSIPLETSLFSIVGGTGAYVGAQGTLSIASVAKSTTKVVATLKFVD